MCRDRGEVGICDAGDEGEVEGDHGGVWEWDSDTAGRVDGE